MTTKPTTMLLEANFDIDQIGETLEWRFSRRDGDGNPITGKYAGGIYFTVGEEMHVRVRAGSYSQFKSFKVLDCTLITRPQIVQIGNDVPTLFAPPSPFVDNAFVSVPGASVTLPGAEFVPSAVHPMEPGYHELALKWHNHLTVGDGVGRWEISFVLTVLIERHDAQCYQRVFCFDPEGEVGSGQSPPH